jgi:hypothetical protein
VTALVNVAALGGHVTALVNVAALGGHVTGTGGDMTELVAA